MDPPSLQTRVGGSFLLQYLLLRLTDPPSLQTRVGGSFLFHIYYYESRLTSRTHPRCKRESVGHLVSSGFATVHPLLVTTADAAKKGQRGELDTVIK
jgi:hypothetical protein